MTKVLVWAKIYVKDSAFLPPGRRKNAFPFLSLALKKLPLGTAYAMWTGFGIIGTSLLGVFVFGEKLTLAQIFCILLIAVGIAGLKILGKE